MLNHTEFLKGPVHSSLPLLSPLSACVRALVVYWPVTSSSLGSIRRSGPLSIALFVRRCTTKFRISAQLTDYHETSSSAVRETTDRHGHLSFISLSYEDKRHWPVACVRSSRLSPDSQTPHGRASSCPGQLWDQDTHIRVTNTHTQLSRKLQKLRGKICAAWHPDLFAWCFINSKIPTCTFWNTNTIQYNTKSTFLCTRLINPLIPLDDAVLVGEAGHHSTSGYQGSPGEC